MSIEKRIAALESRVAFTRPKPSLVLDDDAATSRLTAALLLLGAGFDWRHDVLSLEEKLALANNGRMTRVARELEIKILERDMRIDEGEATRLRKNDHACEFAQPPGTVALLDLPFRLSVNEDALSEALRKCPPRESLALEEQLELARGDNADWYRRRCPAAAHLDELQDMAHRDRVAVLQKAIR